MLNTVSPVRAARACNAVSRAMFSAPERGAEMLKTLGFASLDALIDATVPRKIRLRQGLSLPKGLTELEVLTYFRALAARNQVFRSFIGMGYSDCVTPPV